MKGIKEILIASVVAFLVLAFTQPAFAPPPVTEKSPGSYSYPTPPQPPPPGQTTTPPPDPGRIPPTEGPSTDVPVDVLLPVDPSVGDLQLSWGWERQPDGTVILKQMPGGTTTIRITNVRGNANVTVGFPDGTTAQKILPGGKWVIPWPREGAAQPLYRPAEPDVPPEIVQQPNGDTVVSLPGVGTWTLKPDGTVVQRPRDGTTITFYGWQRLMPQHVWAEGLSDDEVQRLLEEQREREEAERVRIIELRQIVEQGRREGATPEEKKAAEEAEMDLASYEARQRTEEERKEARRGHAGQSQPGSGPRKTERLPERGDGQNLGGDQ